MPVTRRTRKRPSASGSLDELKTLVASLIKENQKLKRQVVRLEAKADGTAANSAAKGLRTLSLRVARALDSAGPAKRRRTSTTTSGRSRGSATTASRSRKPAVARKPASPETQAKRLAALARAREARAAKKAAAS